MPKRRIHLAQFLVHGPTYHSLAMWRHPRTAEAGYDWARPELYQHIARVCERGKFDMVFFADLNYISDTYRGTMDPAIRHATQAPEHDPIPLLSFMASVTSRIGLGATFSISHQHPFYAAFYPGPAISMSYEDLKVIEAFQFLKSVVDGEQGEPGFAEALAVAEVQDAIARSWESGRWEPVCQIQ